MEKTLLECKKGEFVILWCIGWLNWDNDVVEIVKEGHFPEVKHRNGHISMFSSSTRCKTVTF